MYIVKWKADQDYFTGITGNRWQPRSEKTMLFRSVKEAENFIVDIDPFWKGKIEVEFMHPLNLKK